MAKDIWTNLCSHVPRAMHIESEDSMMTMLCHGWAREVVLIDCSSREAVLCTGNPQSENINCKPTWVDYTIVRSPFYEVWMLLRC